MTYILREPSESCLGISMAIDSGDKKNIPSPYPIRITTEHMKTSIGRIPLSGTLPYRIRSVELGMHPK